MSETESGEVPSAREGRGLSLSAWCAIAAFGTYFCMYAFRKPFTAAGYTDATVWGIGYKTVLVTAQVLGYTLSKFLGIKVVAEVQPHRRAVLLLVLIAAAEAALLLFALTPAPFNLIWLFCNGIPLGMVFGLVLGFLEGRRQTEAWTAALCGSFIVADGVTKSAGSWLLKRGVSEYWMPFVAGLLFVPPLVLFTWMLTRIPRPSPLDVAARSKRTPMNRAERWSLFRRHAAGLTLLVLVYLFITILRSLRADFAPEIWSGLGEKIEPELFSTSELVVAAAVLVLNGSMVWLRDNRRAFFSALGVALLGVVLIAVSLAALQQGVVAPFPFMVLYGIGLYLPYLVVQTTIFERLMAMTRERGNIGYLIYLADAFGYLGYVGVLLAHGVLASTGNFVAFFIALSWILVGVCLFLLAACWYCFVIHPATRRATSDIPPELSLGDQGEKKDDFMNVIDRIFTLFREKGNGLYFGEGVTETEHALQCAHLAEESGSAPAPIAAALLHDIGHLLHGLPEDVAERGIDARHEEEGAVWLQRYFGPAVVDPIRLHVAAKRYLCAVEPCYHKGLSEASQRSLQLQGGPMSPMEIDAFEQETWFRAAIAVRRWDDRAKVPGLIVPALEHYRTCLETVLLEREGA